MSNHKVRQLSAKRIHAMGLYKGEIHKIIHATLVFGSISMPSKSWSADLDTELEATDEPTFTMKF